MLRLHRYVVNMHSANFGECMCGEAKANHSPEALSAGEVSKATRADSTEVRSKFVRKKKVDCQRYEADINAAAFGEQAAGPLTPRLSLVLSPSCPA